MPDDADGFSRQLKGVKLGVVARPGGEPMGLAGGVEVANDVAIRVENADRRHVQDRQILLTTRFAQQRLGLKDRRFAMSLVVENGGRSVMLLRGYSLEDRAIVIRRQLDDP